MHPIVFYTAVAWLVALLAVNAVLVLRTRSTPGRILAADTLTLLLIALLVLVAHATDSAYYLDAALVLALLSFIGVLAAARYHYEEKPF